MTVCSVHAVRALPTRTFFPDCLPVENVAGQRTLRRGESTRRTLGLLRRLRARQAANAMRREFEKNEGVDFAWVVLAQPDVAFADDIPVDRMCTVRVPLFFPSVEPLGSTLQKKTFSFSIFFVLCS